MGSSEDRFVEAVGSADQELDAAWAVITGFFDESGEVCAGELGGVWGESYDVSVWVEVLD